MDDMSASNVCKNDAWLLVYVMGGMWLAGFQLVRLVLLGLVNGKNTREIACPYPFVTVIAVVSVVIAPVSIFPTVSTRLLIWLLAPPLFWPSFQFDSWRIANP